MLKLENNIKSEYEGFISIKRGPKFKGKLKSNTGEYVLYVFVSSYLLFFSSILAEQWCVRHWRR